jgi:hypothetical protein
MSDLKTLSMADAREFFDTFYAPNNLTAALVGNLDLAAAKRLAERYFGRLPRGAREVPDVVTLEERQLAEKRMNAECDCQQQVPSSSTPCRFSTGTITCSTSSRGCSTARPGGSTSVWCSASRSPLPPSRGSSRSSTTAPSTSSPKPRATPRRPRWRPRCSPSSSGSRASRCRPSELQKVKNQVVAGSFRNLQNPFFLLVQLLFYEGWGDWTYLNTWADKTLAVTAEDVQRVARKYFTPENRTVATYRRKAGTAAAPVPAELAGLPAPAQRAISSQLAEIRAAEDPALLEQALASVAAQQGAVPPEYAPALALVERTIQERLAALRAAANDEEEEP